jgi:hypothetical protein
VRFFLSRAYSKTFRQILAYLDRLPIDPKDVNLDCEEFGEIGETCHTALSGHENVARAEDNKRVRMRINGGG